LFFFHPFGGHPELYSAGKIVLLFLASVFLIPYPAMPGRYFNLFGLNAPAWSLFWEYIANIVYAFVLYRLSRKYILLLTIISAVGICLVAFRAGNMMGGWDGLTFWDGGVRVSFSFLAGLLVYRSGWIIKNRFGFFGVALLLMLALLSPFSKWNWLSEPFIIVIYFPLLIALSAGATLTPAFKKICVFSGKISYPIYMTHYAFIWIFASYYASHKPAAGQLALIIITSLILLVGFAWFAMVVYDIPVRKYLSGKRKQAIKE